MASEKLRKQQADQGEELPVDMSSMIDLVFLLLIFFMVSSHLIKLKIDDNVEPPKAKNATAPESIDARIIINIYADGTVMSTDAELTDKDDIVLYVQRLVKHYENVHEGVKPRIHLRADQNVETRAVKRVIQAAGDGGVDQIIFSSIPR